jgi:hypothetical protein
MQLRIALLITIATAAGAAGGCGKGGTADTDAARTSVERFYDAIRADDAETACRLLTPDALKALQSQTGEQCRNGITELELTGGAVVRTTVQELNAKVDLRTGESAYVDGSGPGWKLSALGCRPEEGDPKERPMDCELES